MGSLLKRSRWPRYARRCMTRLFFFAPKGRPGNGHRLAGTTVVIATSDDDRQRPQLLPRRARLLRGAGGQVRLRPDRPGRLLAARAAPRGRGRGARRREFRGGGHGAGRPLRARGAPRSGRADAGHRDPRARRRRPAIAPIFLPCDVQDDAQVDALSAALRERWGRLDFALHAVAFAPKADLQGRLTDSSREGFLTAMDISCHSFIRLARRAEPLMTDGGTLLTLSFAGAERVVQNYDVMGPVKAALECAVRYLAYELGPKGIRVNALSPGPIHTRAASGLKDFDTIILEEQRKAPLGRLAEIDDVGAVAAFLTTPAARAITGMTIYVDCGYHIMG